MHIYTSYSFYCWTMKYTVISITKVHLEARDMILMGFSTLLALSQQVHRKCHVSSYSISLAAKPGILSGFPGYEGHFPAHFCWVDPPAGLKAPPLTLSAGLLVVPLELHCFNNAVPSQEPGVCRENMWRAHTWGSIQEHFQQVHVNS